MSEPVILSYELQRINELEQRIADLENLLRDEIQRSRTLERVVLMMHGINVAESVHKPAANGSNGPSTPKINP